MRLRLRIFGRKRRPSMALLGTDGGTAATWREGFGWLRDVSPAAWIGPRLHPFAQDVGSIIPEGFHAYARLFHPVPVDPDRRERWSNVAQRNRRIVHPEMQFHQISVPRGQVPIELYGKHEPRHGTLVLDQRRALVEHLTKATATPDQCWFAIWEGFGGLDEGVIRERLRLPKRNYLLYTGGLARALESPLPFDQSPNLWWPEDRAWFVASEIDFAWTYVGGAQSLIAALLSDSRLEVLPAALTEKVQASGDRINAALNVQQEDGPVVDPTTGPE